MKNSLKKMLYVLIFMILFTLISCTEQSEDILPTNLILNQSEISLNVGETFQIIATFTPNDVTNQNLEYIYESSHITVSNSGLITAISVGQETVRVKTINKIEATIIVNVIDTINEIPVENIIVGLSTVRLEVGTTYQIEPTIIPSNATNKSLTYFSNNESVATVNSSGLISTYKEGNTTITIAAGSQAQTTINVIVEVPEVPISSNQLGASLFGKTPTSGFDLTHSNDVLPYVKNTGQGEQRIYFTQFDRANYVVSVKIKAGNNLDATIPKAGIIVGENSEGMAAFAIDFKTRVEVYAGYRTTTGQWDWLEPGGNSNAPVAVSPLINLVEGTTLKVVRIGTTYYCFIEDEYIFQRKISQFGNQESIGLMTEGAEAIFSDYYVTDHPDDIENQMAKIDDKTGKSVLTIGDSLFDYYDDAINDTIQTFIYESGYSHFYKDNVGGSKITPEVNLSGRSIVNHIDVGTYEAYSDLDLIIIQRGTNDVSNWRNNNVIKGSIGNEDKTTTFGAMAYIMDYFRTTYPNARIIWSTVIFRGDSDYGAEHAEYNNALYEIAPTYDVEIFDLRTAIGIDQSNFQTFLSGDKLHLSAAGEVLMKNAWLDYLSDIDPVNRVSIQTAATSFLIDLAQEQTVEFIFDVSGLPVPNVTLVPKENSGFTINPLNPYQMTFSETGTYEFTLIAENEFDADSVTYSVTVVDTTSGTEDVLLDANFSGSQQYVATKTGDGAVNIVDEALQYSVTASGSAFADFIFDSQLVGLVVTEIEFSYHGNGNSSFLNLLYMYSANANLTGVGGSIAYSFAVGGRNDVSPSTGAHLRVNNLNNAAGSQAIIYNESYIYINQGFTYKLKVVTDYTTKVNHLYVAGGDFNDGTYEFIGTFGFRNETTITQVLRTGTDKAASTGVISSIKVYSVE